MIAPTIHLPVLLGPIVDALIEPFAKRAEPAWLVDCTLGGGGHTEALHARLTALGKGHRLLAVDQDEQAIARARERFARPLAEGTLRLHHGPFGEVVPVLKSLDAPILGLLADLGFSSDQIEDAERGLSFIKEGPLDMRLDPSSGISCREYLARVGEKELADAIFQYGEERYSRRIASAIARARSDGALPETTTALAELIWRAVPPPARRQRIHPATRTFQALRIVVNDELGQLERLIQDVLPEIAPGGRAAIISFHSLEDRKVKQAFKGSAFRQLTKKPIEPDQAEVKANPRARSAKLRIAEKSERAES